MSSLEKFEFSKCVVQWLQIYVLAEASGMYAVCVCVLFIRIWKL